MRNAEKIGVITTNQQSYSRKIITPEKYEVANLPEYQRPQSKTCKVYTNISVHASGLHYNKYSYTRNDTPVKKRASDATTDRTLTM